MNSQLAVRRRLHSVLQSLNVALITVLVMLVLSGSSLAQRQLPFIGTRTFCSEDDEGQATITIRKDGFTTVKSDMVAEDEVGPFAFSGMLSAKGIVRREPERYLEIISPRAIRMHDGGVKIDGRPCSEVLARESIVFSVAFSPDGRTLASGNRSSTIKLWDVASGQELRTLIGHSHSVTSLAFSPDGKTLASGSEDFTIRLWDVASGQELKTLKGNIFSVAFSPDGKTLASGDDVTVRLWDVASGRALRTLRGHSGVVRSVAFSPDGKTLESGSWDFTIKLWDVASGQALRTLKDSNAVVSVAFSPDGKTLASGSVDIKLWNVASGQVLKTLKRHSNWTSVAFCSDGRTLASGGDDNGTIKLWDVASGRELKTLTGHSSVVLSVACSPDGKTLASGSDDKTIKLWDVTSGQELKTLKVRPNGSQDAQLAPTAQRTDVSPTQTATSRPPAPTSPSGTSTGEIVNETKTDSSAFELSYWETIKNSTDPEDFKAYLDKYPNGKFAELARSRMQQLARPAGNPASRDVTTAERARNTHAFEVRDASKTAGWLTVAPGSVTFEPKKAQEGKNITIQCSEIKNIEQGQSTVASPHVNLFLNGKEGPVVFYTSSGGTGVVGVFVKGLPAKPVVDITANVISAITEACR